MLAERQAGGCMVVGVFVGAEASVGLAGVTERGSRPSSSHHESRAGQVEGGGPVMVLHAATPSSDPHYLPRCPCS